MSDSSYKRTTARQRKDEAKKNLRYIHISKSFYWSKGFPIFSKGSTYRKELA